MKFSRIAHLVVAFLVCFSCAAQTAAPDEWAPVGKTLGRSGKLQDGVYKVTFPRTDLYVRIGNTKVEAAAGLGSWMAFRKTASGAAIADGDLVLLADEVNPVISALQAGRMEVTAIHNHLIGEQPQVMYVHFFGQGDAQALATTLKSALDKTKTPTVAAASPPAIPFPDQKLIETTLGKSGTVNGKVLAFGFPRPHAISMHKETLPPAMGMATAINFQPSPKGVAATGDFVLGEDEVQRVVAALRKGDIAVTAMHNHLLDDEPRMVFVHFWAEGAAETVAKTLKTALDAVTQNK
ncbi:MAG: peptidase [Acidobacteriales bacterium]|nr:peptidase [Terriglobales bacterium]